MTQSFALGNNKEILKDKMRMYFKSIKYKKNIDIIDERGYVAYLFKKKLKTRKFFSTL